MTAITGLAVGLYQNGVFGTAQGRKDSATPEAHVQAATAPVQAMADPPPKPVDPAPARPAASPATILVTARDGRVTPVFAASFQQMGSYDGQLRLSSGQSIAVANLDSLEVAKAYEDHVQVRITLVGGRVIEDALPAGSSINGFDGENDDGKFSIGVDRLQRLALKH